MKLFQKKDDKAKAKKKKPDTGADESGSSESKKKRGGGGDGIQMLLANHIEKLVFGFAVLFALFMVIKGFSARVAIEDNKAPDQLQQQAQQATTQINAHVWNEFRAERDRDKNFLERSNETQQKVDANNYSIGQLIKPPYMPAKTLRTDPVLLAARDLRVVPGFGPLVINERGGPELSRIPDAPIREKGQRPWQQWIRDSGDQTQGVYFNAITALIPYQEQLAEFAVLKNTEGYEESRDQPKYLAWALLREEVISGQPVKKKRILFDPSRKHEANWGGEGDSTVDPPSKFQHEILTGKVPPILMDEMPRFALHPGIPREVPEGAEDAPPETSPTAPADDEDLFQFSVPQTEKSERQVEKRQEGRGDDLEVPPEYYLFRYFDIDVRPGRTYRYKLVMLMDDPNSPIEGTPPSADTLDQSVSERLVNKRRPGITTPASDPSAPVFVAEGSRVLAGEVTPADSVALSDGGSFPRDEPSATIMATTFMPESGANIPAVMNVHRGSVANYIQSVWYWPPKGSRAQRVENHPFKTDSTILDIRGGNTLADTGLKAPGQLLVFDGNGRMSVIDELKDATGFESNRVPEPEVVPRNGTRREQEGLLERERGRRRPVRDRPR